MALLNQRKSCDQSLNHVQELKDSAAEAQAHGNMGLTRMNLLHFEEAIANFEKELECLDAKMAVNGGQPLAGGQPTTPPAATGTKEKARALGSLGDCFDALGDYNQSVKYHEQFLGLALETGSLRDQDKAYRGLGLANKNLGNLQEALVSRMLRIRPEPNLFATSGSDQTVPTRIRPKNVINEI